jgi:hypothetical protein
MCGCLLAGSVALGATGASATTPVSALGSPRSDLVAPHFPVSTTPKVARAWLTKALGVRIVALSTLDGTVLNSTTLTPTDRQALVAVLFNDSSGLTLLRTRAVPSANLTTLSALASAMVLDYHVFALVTPEVNDIVAADSDLAVHTSLAGQLPAIQAAIAVSGKSGARKAARQLVVVLTGQIAQVASDAGGIASELLRLVPADVPAELPLLTTVAHNLTKAKSAIAAANLSLGSILQLLAKA